MHPQIEAVAALIAVELQLQVVRVDRAMLSFVTHITIHQ
jgi:hypothetical protein